VLHPLDCTSVPPDLFRQLETRLESMLDTMSDTLVRDVLTKLDPVDTAILAGLPTAGLREVDEILFFATRMAELRRAGRRYVGQIPVVLGVPIVGDHFGASGTPNASRASG
jgi:hypothetical protein